MTPQEIFTLAYTSVIAQGRQSKGDHQGCKCRGPDGLKCAIGFMIDHETAALWDTQDGITEVTDPPNWVSDNIHLLNRIQSAHDARCAPPYFFEDYKARMKSVANLFELEIPA